MTPHETLQEMLPLSAAGLLEPAEERQVRQHVRECPECAARLDSFADLSAVLGSLATPPPPADLAARAQALVTAELADFADRRQGALLAAGSAVLAWMLALASGYVYHLFAGGGMLAWVLWSTVPACMAAPVMAGLFRDRRLERILS